MSNLVNKKINQISGLSNYILNSSPHDNTVGWSITKNTSASASPDSGFVTSGVTNTWTRSTSAPLRGDASFLFGLGALGNQAIYDFTIDSADKFKVIQGSLEYGVASGTFADDSVSVWIWDITNSRFIQPVPSYLKNHSLPAEKFPFEFQCSDSASYRLVLHQAAASTAVLKIDNVSVGPQAKLYGSPVTDWVSYAPTGSWTTNATYYGKWRRVGDQMEVDFRIAMSGAGTATDLTINLPQGYSIDTSKLTGTVFKPFGIWNYHDAGSTIYGPNSIAYTTVNSVLLYINNNQRVQTTANFSDGAVVINITVASGDEMIGKFSVPILGWSSSQIMSHDANTRVVAARVYKNGTQAVGGGDTKITSFTVDDDKVGMWDSVNNRFNIKTPGDYDLIAQINATAAATKFMPAYTINGGSKHYIGVLADGTGGDRSGSTAFIPNLKAGDYVEVYISAGGSGATIQAGNTNTFMSLVMRQGPAQIMASESIDVSAYTSAGPTINNTSPSINFGTVEWQTHGNYSGGVFTADSPGKYEFNCPCIRTASTSFGANHAVAAYIQTSYGLQKYIAFQRTATAYTGSMELGGSGIVRLKVGEYAYIRIYSDTSSTLDSTNPGAWNTLQIKRVGNY